MTLQSPADFERALDWSFRVIGKDEDHAISGGQAD